MTVLSDREILELIQKAEWNLVEPFDPEIVRENGLDLRFGRVFCRIPESSKLVIDSMTLKLSNGARFEDILECVEVSENEGFVIRPYDRVLAHTLEYIRLPPDIVGLCNLRSTFARLGIYIPPTVVDAGFEGQLTIEIVGGPIAVRVYPGQRFLHLILIRTGKPVANPYRGKYQGQRNVTPPRPDWLGGRVAHSRGSGTRPCDASRARSRSRDYTALRPKTARAATQVQDRHLL